ncbi:hypothetical protein EEB11_12445 [Pseudotabrizicola sediminis]|uniref:Uncharacterized protein n=1 Tax=Pseudotabrizicola sediminis TaxID=2486418 RepID=A0ABY2KL00_9RHOB|nr:hypothetical protein EEB11_12445 [Pseudotabrizicola sediminis]
MMLCAGGCQDDHAHMVMVTRVVMATGQVMPMAVRGVKGAIFGFGHQCARTMLDCLNCRRCGQG